MAVIETHDEVTVVEIEEERVTVGVEPMGVLYTENGIVGGGPMNRDVYIGLDQWVLDDLEQGHNSVQTITGTPDEIDVDSTDPKNPVISLNDTVLSAIAGADPTALVGLTPVPGISDTFIRADGAPALDQAIEPTWTGNHTFEGDVAFTGNTTVDGSPIMTEDSSPDAADPSSLIGLEMIPGIAITWMRSDGAPALDQGIEPTWTGDHTFEGDVAFDGGAITIDGSLIITDDTVPKSANPTALVSLIAVSGIADTWMRSDAAPALDPTISPTWTGQHTFNLPPLLSVDPASAMEVATKQYVDAVAAGLNPKLAVLVATTTNIVLSGEQTIDDVVVPADQRVLAKNQTNPAENGIYISATEAWTRSPGMDKWQEVPSAYTFVEEGTINADTAWVCIANKGGVLNTSPMPWVQFAGAGTYTNGFGLLLTGTQFSLDQAASPTWTGDHIFEGDVAFTGDELTWNGSPIITADTVPASVFGADPTALVGLEAIDGVAATFMRSDAAPALDESITPSWSGIHNFLVPPTIDGVPIATNELFTDTTNGLTPASGGGTDNFLRADGSWITPPVPKGDGYPAQLGYAGIM